MFKTCFILKTYFIKLIKTKSILIYEVFLQQEGSETKLVPNKQNIMFEDIAHPK